MSKGKKLLEKYKRKLLYFYEVSHVIKNGIDYLQSLYGEKLILPGIKLLRNFCNEVRKTNLYVNKMKLEE